MCGKKEILIIHKISPIIESTLPLLIGMAYAGQLQQATLINTVDVKKKFFRALRRKLSAFNGYTASNDTTICCVSGCEIPGVALWGGTYTLDGALNRHRYRLLLIFRFGVCEIWALPATSLDSLTKLPGSQFSTSEVATLIDIANTLFFLGDTTEHLLDNAESAAELIRAKTRGTDAVVPDSDILGLFRRIPYLLCCLIAVLDTIAHSFLSGLWIPCGMYNFVIDGKTSEEKGQRLIRFAKALTELNYTNKPGQFDWKPIVSDAGSDCLVSRDGRLVLLTVKTRAQIASLLLSLKASEAAVKAGGKVTPIFETVPITCTAFPLADPYAIDIPDTEGTLDTDLSTAELDALHSALAGIDPKKLTRKAEKRFLTTISAPDAHRVNRFRAWQQALLSAFCDCRFPNGDAGDLMRCWWNCTAIQETSIRQDELAVNTAFSALIDIDAYNESIIEKPTTKAEAEEALEASAYAFFYTPTRGDHIGKHFLAFSNSSLHRFLADHGCQAELYDAFIERCAEILIGRSMSVSLGSKTFTAVVFDETAMKQMHEGGTNRG